MIKNTGYRKLGKTTSHRKAMLSNMAVSIVLHEEVKTTLPKAKEVRREVEGLITLAKNGEKLALKNAVNDKLAYKKLVEVLSERYAKRDGGYTRIYRAGIRKGDNAEVAIIKLVD
ncbi:50S ribosomal protein L17 [Candidatus Proelusimicrobium volucris]|uniref:50S ribosomal protein L17 n=1 Tax=Candidatus Proelusimicrobium volucris TaxID=3416225 RepID=UPI003D0D4EC5